MLLSFKIVLFFVFGVFGQYPTRQSSNPYRGGYGNGNRNNIPKQCLKPHHEWKDLEYDFPSRSDREIAQENGNYVEGNGVPIDVAPFYRTDGSLRIFVTIPRFTTGIPFSLAVVSSRRSGPKGPLLKAFPGYEWHSSHGQDCDGITSVFRVAIDECNRLWVLDTGKVGSIQYCHPQLLVFDLENDSLVHRYRFPDTQYKNTSLFITPMLDVHDPPPRGTCQKVKVYIADVTGYGILVYDLKKESSWRTENKLMKSVSQYGNFTIAGESFTLMDGVFGLSVTPRHICQDSCERYLYFHALASNTENKVPLSVMNDCRTWQINNNAYGDKFEVVGTREVQTAAMAIDKKGHLFSSPVSPIGISFWNIEKPYTTTSMKVENAQTLQFISGMKIVRNKFDQDELWVSSCRFQKIMAGTINHNETNFRIQSGLVNDILAGPC